MEDLEFVKKENEALKLQIKELNAQAETRDALITAQTKAFEELANKLQFAQEAKERAEDLLRKYDSEAKAREASSKELIAALRAKQAAKVGTQKDPALCGDDVTQEKDNRPTKNVSPLSRCVARGW